MIPVQPHERGFDASTFHVGMTVGSNDQPVSDHRSHNAEDLVRVMHVINGEHYSGAERVQDLLAKCLPEEGFSAGFACVKLDRFAEMRQATDAPIYDLRMRSKFDVRVAWKLAELVRSEQYKIVHAHTPRTALIGRIAASRAKVPFVYHVHSPTSRDSTRRLHNWLNTKIENWSIRDAELITVSQSLGRHVEQLGFSSERITVVPNGVPVAKTTRSSTLPSGQWTLGTVALFRPRKGTEVLVDAIARLRDAGHNVRLRAVGSFETSDYENELKSRTGKLEIEDYVDWTGFTRNVNAELAKMDLFVLPSLFGEGLPMVVLEAMAAGVPVVGTNVEGVPEAIRDGVDGVIAEPRDATDLARAIEKIISGEIHWDLLRSNAMQRHADSFSDRSMAAGVAQVYRKLLS